MVLRSILPIFFSISINFHVFSQGNSLELSADEKNLLNNWKEGNVVFKEGDNLNCFLSYESYLSNNVLYIREKNEIFAFRPEEVKSFSFFDPKCSEDREFECLFSDQKGIFVEVLYRDPFLFIKKLKKISSS